MKTKLYQNIKDGAELGYVIDIINNNPESSSGDLFYDLQTLHTQVSELEINEIHMLCNEIKKFVK